MRSHFLRCSIPYMLGLLVCVAVSGKALAQTTTGEIRGVVTDASSGEPLVGAQVSIADSKLGTTTNINGEYTLRRLAPGEYTLIAKYVGFKSVSRKVTVVAGESVKQDFAITPTAVTADELIVTGQGVATEKRKMVTAVEAINSDRIANSTAKSLDQLLQGNVPGLTAYLPSGMPGTGARIQTRGIKSVLGATNPVIYVDGVRMDNGDNFALANGRGGQVSSALADLLVGDNIERVEVIKGGAATTLYGSDGANGVIQIFTKKGSAGEAKWNVGLLTGADNPETRWTFSDYVRNNFYQTGLFQQYKGGVTGGSEALSYNLNGQIRDSRGIMTGDRLIDRAYNVSAGLRAIASEKADIEVSANFTRTQFGSWFINNAGGSALNTIETEAAFEEPVLRQRGFDVSTPQRLAAVRDSLYRQYLVLESNEQVTRPYITLNFNYAPTKSFNNKFIVGMDYRKNEARDFVPINSGEAFNANGALTRTDREFTQITLQYTGSLKLPDLGVMSNQLIFGFQGFRQETREFFGSGSNFALPGTRDFDNASVITAGEFNFQNFTGGFYLSDQIGISDRLFIDAGIRLDGSTAFGKDVSYLVYPKIGVAYNISEEEFYPESLRPIISSVKLRAAYGVAGEFPTRLGQTAFLRDRAYGAQPFNAESGITFNIPGNANLTAAVTGSLDIGTDISLFQDRVSVEFNYYSQVTTGSFFSVPEDPASGFVTQQRNVGRLDNNGIELSILANVIQSPTFDLSLRGSVTTLSNKVADLGGSSPFSVGGFAYAPTRVELNQPVGAIRVNVPRPDADGVWRGGFDQIIAGNPTPSTYGSFGFDMTLFKDLTISAIGEFSLGHQLLNQWRARRQVNVAGTGTLINGVPSGRRYSEPGNGETVYLVYQDIARDMIRNPITNNLLYVRDPASTSLLTNADWVKIREITVRYRVPRSLFSNLLGGITLSATVRNPIVLFSPTEIDSESQFIREGRALNVGGIAGGTVSAARQFRFGIDINL